MSRFRRQRRLAADRAHRRRPHLLDPELAKAEIGTFRYRIVHAAAQLVSKARRIELRIDTGWHWAAAITTAFGWQRAAFGYQ